MLNFGQSTLWEFTSQAEAWIQMGLGSLGQDCLNKCTIKLSLLKHENKWPDGGLLSTQQLPQNTTSLIFSYHRPFVMISTIKAEICIHSAAVFCTHSCTHWPRSSGVEETARSCSPQSSAAIPTWLELTAESFPQLLQPGDKPLLAAHVLRCVPWAVGRGLS